MANVTFPTAVSVADIETLKAIDSSNRADKSLRIVVNPGDNLPPTWYQFKADSTFEEILPTIIEPSSGTGRWIQEGKSVHYGATEPIGAPPLKGMQWIFGSKVWESIGTNTIADWVELKTSDSSTGEEYSIAVVSVDGDITLDIDSATYQIFDIQYHLATFLVRLPRLDSDQKKRFVIVNMTNASEDNLNYACDIQYRNSNSYSLFPRKYGEFIWDGTRWYGLSSNQVTVLQYIPD